MTGTAATEAQEFAEIYNLPVLEIPTNVEMIRKDENDIVFLTQTEKYEADHSTAVLMEVETGKIRAISR